MMCVHRDHQRPAVRSASARGFFTRAPSYAVLLFCAVCVCLTPSLRLVHSVSAQDAPDQPEPKLQREDPNPNPADTPERDRPPTERRDRDRLDRGPDPEQRRGRNESDERNRLERAGNQRRDAEGRRQPPPARERLRPRESTRDRGEAEPANRFGSAINGEIVEMLRQLRRDVDELRDDFYKDRQDRMRDDPHGDDPRLRETPRLGNRPRRANDGDRLPPVSPRAGDRPPANGFSNNRLRTEGAGSQQARQLQQTVQELRQEILRLRQELEQSRGVDTPRDPQRDRSLGPADRPSRNRASGTRSRGRIRPSRETDRPRPQSLDPEPERNPPPRDGDDTRRPDPPRDKDRPQQPDPGRDSN